MTSQTPFHLSEYLFPFLKSEKEAVKSGGLFPVLNAFLSKRRSGSDLCSPPSPSLLHPPQALPHHLRVRDVKGCIRRGVKSPTAGAADQV